MQQQHQASHKHHHITKTLAPPALRRQNKNLIGVVAVLLFMASLRALVMTVMHQKEGWSPQSLASLQQQEQQQEQGEKQQQQQQQQQHLHQQQHHHPQQHHPQQQQQIQQQEQEQQEQPASVMAKAAAAAVPAPPRRPQSPPPPSPPPPPPGPQLPTDLCASPGSLHHVSMMEDMIQPSYEQVLGAMADLPQGTWLQVGANTMNAKDAKDPLKEWLDALPGAWSKVFVEPIPALFAQLNQSIARWGPNATAVNVAIAPDATVPESEVKMHCLQDAFAAGDEEEEEGGKGKPPPPTTPPPQEEEDTDNLLLPYWADQICSFNESHVAKHFPGKASMTVSVTAWSLPELLRRQGIENVEVLVMDTEGYDFQVLKQIPFARIRPRLIVYEHQHLTPAEEKEAEALLRRQCYAVWELDADNHAALALYV